MLTNFIVDYPPPMSDQFLVLLTQSIENPNFEVGVSLGVSRVDTNSILEDKLMATEEHKLLAVFNFPFLFYCKYIMCTIFSNI